MHCAKLGCELKADILRIFDPDQSLSNIYDPTTLYGPKGLLFSKLNLPEIVFLQGIILWYNIISAKPFLAYPIFRIIP